jgi:hypothetical protein
MATLIESARLTNRPHDDNARRRAACPVASGAQSRNEWRSGPDLFAIGFTQTDCSSARLKLYETAIGFKYIAELMLNDDILIGAEESGGIGVKNHIPERTAF